MKIGGFTLVEMMVTVGVAAILLAVAVPSFTTFTQNNRLVAQRNEFIATLHLARSEAVKRGIRMTICKSADATACTGSGGWEQGWIVFADADNDAAVDTGEGVLLAHEPLRGNVTLRGDTDIANYISYVPGGYTQLAGGAPQTGTLVLCDNRGFGTQTGAIVIGTTGRPRSAAATELGLTDCTP